MRISITLLLISFYISVTPAQTITDKTPWFPSYELTSITFYGDITGWMTSKENKLMKSTDGGMTWNEFSTTPPMNKIFAFSESSLIARDRYGKSYYSENGGLTWDSISYPTGLEIKTIYPINFNTLVAGGTKKTIIKSTDRGVHWEIISNDTSGYIYDAMYFFDERNGWVNCFWPGTQTSDNGMYRTIDGGNNWFKISNWLLEMQFADLNNGTAGGGDDVYRTTNGGVTWEMANNLPFYAYYVNHKQTKDNIVFLSQGWNSNGSYLPSVLVSTDGGLTWLESNFLNDNFRINDIFVFDDGRAIICGEKGYVGIMNEWLKFTPLNGEYINKVVSFPDRVYAIGKNCFYRITGNGDSWEQIYTDIRSNEWSDIIFLDSLRGLQFVPTENWEDISIWNTTKGGLNWIKTNHQSFMKARFGTSVGNTIFLYGNDKLYRTKDLGESWSSKDIPNIYQITFIDSLTGWMTVWADPYNETYHKLFKTTTAGETWDEIAEIPFMQSIQFITADSAWGVGAAYFYYTNNGGLTWNIYNKHLSNYHPVYSRDIKFRYPGDFLYIETGMYLSGDESLNNTYLHQVSNGVQNEILHFIAKHNVNIHFYNNNNYHGWLAGGRKLYRIDYDVAAVEPNETAAVPDQYVLFQNYPNPFNPTTTIKYSVPLQGRVILQVTDILGNTIKELVNEELPPGTYETLFNASGLSSGIYFYTIRAGTFTTTRKLMLLK